MKVENIALPVLAITATGLLLKLIWPKGITPAKQRQSLLKRFNEHKDVFTAMSDTEIVFSYAWIAVKAHNNNNTTNAFLTQNNNAETLKSIQNKYKIFT